MVYSSHKTSKVIWCPFPLAMESMETAQVDEATECMYSQLWQIKTPFHYCLNSHKALTVFMFFAVFILFSFE